MENKSSFIGETLSVEHALIQSFTRDVGAMVQSRLKSFDDFISTIHDHVTHGVKINVARGIPVSIGPEDLRKGIGEDLFSELEKIAFLGREALTGMGFDGRPRPQKSVLVGGPATGAAALVQVQESELLGEPGLLSVAVTGVNAEAGKQVGKAKKAAEIPADTAKEFPDAIPQKPRRGTR